MAGDSNAVKSSGGSVVLSATNESTLQIENANVSAEIDSELNLSLFVIPQCLMLVCALRLRYEGREETPVTDYPFLMTSFVCSSLLSILLMVVLCVDTCVSFTNKSGALYTILKRVFRFSSYVALQSLIVMLVKDFISK